MKNKNEQGNKREKIPVTSFVLPSGILGEMIYDGINHKTCFAVHAGKQILEIESFGPDNSFDYIPYEPSNPLLIHKTIRFPNAVGDDVSVSTLVNEIKGIIYKYVELPKVFEEIAVHYVLLTWLYDHFNELPYLRVRGDYGSGKTRFLTVVGSLCYKPIIASGASTVAPLFHILDQIGGTLILDEADFRFSSETADITKILNNGNAKGFPVLRCEKVNKGEFKPRAYHVFGPKLIASRKGYHDDALESRCISCDMGNEPQRKGTPTTLPPSFDEEVMSIRNKLLTYRLRNHEKPHSFGSCNSDLLSRRSNQIYAPLLSFVSDVMVRDEIISFARHQSEQLRTDQGLKTEAELLQVIQDLMKSGPVSISKLTRRFSQEHGKQYERKITPKWIGGIVRNRLRLATRKSSGVYIISEGQQNKLERLYEKFDLA